MLVLLYSLLVCSILFVRCQVSVVSEIASLSPRSVPLVRRSRPHRNATELATWLQQQKDLLETKYDITRSPQHKRASGVNLLTNQGSDSSFYGSIAVGTPAVAYNVMLDTGSSDLWLASSNDLSATTNDIPTFNPSDSSTFSNLNEAFQVQYGSGTAQGTLGSDVVQMAGFQVNTQPFGIVTQISGSLLASPVAGLMGLGFQTIAASGATPFWEALVNQNGMLDAPLMAFQLTRFLNVSGAQELEPGGMFTLGAVDNSLFTGNIDYQSIPNGQEGYWIQELSGLTVNGNSVALTSGSASYAAIDTGTTLVSGPPAAVAALYAQIPGSQALTGENAGFYSYPCSTNVAVTLRFGSSSISWPISTDDFVVGVDSSGTTCIGGLFSLDTTGSSAPPWIIGDTFLKNVYSVFRANPAAVGFAQLSQTAIAQDGQVGSPPSPTIGSVTATVSGGTAGVGATATNRAFDPNGAIRIKHSVLCKWMSVLLTVLLSGGLVL